MAFIRRHRMVLVPLSVAVFVGAGALLLLRGESDETGGSVGIGGNVSSGEPRVTVQAWQEDVAKRTQHGREYRFVYTTEYTDPDTDETVTDQYTSTVRERGASICYKDASGEWVPSVAEWTETATGFKMDTNSWQVEVPATLAGTYSYTVGGKTLAMRPSYLLLSDGVRTVSLGSLDTTVTGQIDESDPSKLVFSDVLGANSGVDIELIVECASLHQNVVLRSKPSLPVTFNEENARLYVYTELGLDALTADGTVSVSIGDTDVNTGAANLLTARNTADPIAFTLTSTVAGRTREDVLHRFVESRVWDANGPEHEASAARQLWRNPADSRTYLVESIDFAWVDDTTGAITIDYQSVNGSIEEDETWTADATYYVSDTVTIGENITLTIEPGTVVKFAEDTRIWAQETNSAVIAKGEPYNYIVFTSDTDDSAGVDLTPGEATSGARSYYSNALFLDYQASGDSAIEYCKAAYAVIGFAVSGELAIPIQHCIVSTCWYGITPARRESTSGSDLLNCLVLDCKAGICPWHEDAATYGYTISNCTFADACSRGIEIHIEGTDPTLSIDIRDNLFTGCTTAGIKMVGTDTVNWTVKYNAAYATDPMYVNISSYSNPISLTASPYETGVPTGDYYLNDTPNGGEECRKTEGSRTYTDAGLADEVFTYVKPNSVSSSISTATWQKIEAGDDWYSDNVGIGYHHCRIDYAVNDQSCEIADGETLTIDPGVVVAFCEDDARLSFDDSATGTVRLTCGGDAEEFTILAGKPLVSMEVEAQYVNSAWWDYPHKGVLLDDPSASETVSITYTRVIGMHKGIEIAFDMDSGDAIQNCVFERGIVPLHMSGAADREITVANCLLRDNLRGAVCDLNSSSTTTITLRNCTLDGQDVGLLLREGTTGASAIVRNCLFTDSTNGIQVKDSAALDCLTEEYNAYWNCGPANSLPIWREYSPYGAEMPDATSLLLTASPYDTNWEDGNWADQWYLAQDDTYVTPCVDGGHTLASADGIRLERFTTAFDGMVDTGMVDIGYHYGGELAGVEKIELKVDGDPIVNAYFSSSHTLQIVIDFTNNSGTWEIFVNGETTDQTGTGDMNGVADPDAQLDFTGWAPGEYTIKITYTAGATDDIEFTIYIDNALPAVIIKSPAGGSDITGY